MIVNRICLLSLIAFVVEPSSQAARRSGMVSDIYGNQQINDDAKFPPTSCCVIPTCNRPGECYQTLSCGYMCSTGRYPPAEYSKTPGYLLKNSYSRYDCRFGDCKYYEFKCNHCQDPRESDFSIYLVRDDCKDCYYRG